jgi:hypothetical protein
LGDVLSKHEKKRKSQARDKLRDAKRARLPDSVDEPLEELDTHQGNPLHVSLFNLLYINITHHTSAVSTFLVRQDLYQNVIDKLAISTLNFDTWKNDKFRLPYWSKFDIYRFKFVIYRLFIQCQNSKWKWLIYQSHFDTNLA